MNGEQRALIDPDRFVVKRVTWKTDGTPFSVYNETRGSYPAFYHGETVPIGFATSEAAQQYCDKLNKEVNRR